MTARTSEKYTQQGQLISIQTPLGPDALLLRSFSGHEAISQLFEFRLELFSKNPDVDFDQIIGRNVNITVKQGDGMSERNINGYVSRFARLPREGRLERYEAVIVPWLWFLTRTTDCRIFQRQTVPQIIEAVFLSFGFTNFKDQLRGNYKPWEYCVQYRETACNFVMRLMEQEGIFFYFEHAKGSHTLVLGDTPVAHQPCPYQSTFEFAFTERSSQATGQD